MVEKFEFESRDAASAAAAARMAGRLGAALQVHERTSFVVSGGTTPTRCFAYLADYELPWDRCRVVLSDERWVPAEHPDSNERLVMDHLLVNQARNTALLSLYQSNVTVEERCAALKRELPEHAFACALVGMGADGHFASLFPDAIDLSAGLASDNENFYLPIRTAASPHERVSMTLAALSHSAEIIVLFFGAEKRAVFDAALNEESAYPIASLLQRDDVDISLFWAS